MKFVVCIKQVPEASELKFDAETRTLVREGVPNVVNPFDRRSLAEAIRLRNFHGGEVVVITMGPPQARDALVECLAAGADRAIHLQDKAFAGADTLATARTLAMALKDEMPDMIFCGKYSVDAETGQVGPELAEILDVPQVTGATKIEISSEGALEACAPRTVVVERETDLGFETIECDLPVVLTAAERLVRPIKVKDEQLEAARTKPIRVVTAFDLASDHSIFGLAGSPTVVTEIRSLARRRVVEMIEGATPGEKAARLFDRLRSRALAVREAVSSQPVLTARETRSSGREVWVFAELLSGQLRPVTFELLGKGVELARELGGSVAVVVAGKGAGEQVKRLAAYGADKVYFADDESLAEYTTARYTALLANAIQAYQPVIVLLPSTANGRDLAPRVAARMAVGLTADCIDLDINDRGELVQHKPAFGGNIVALIVSRTIPQMATVRPGVLKPAIPDYSRSATVTCLAVPKPRPAHHSGPLVFEDRRSRLVSFRREVPAEVSELEQAETIICVGTGIGSEAALSVIDALARAAGGVIGATRRVVDNGWLPRQQQIGLTGKIVAPRLYIGVGVRGAFNHTIGIQQSGSIAAINSDPNAEIFKTADFGVVGDWAEIVPALTELFRSSSSRPG